MEIAAAMLADSAVVVQDKLYVHGGGWDRIWAQSVPAIHATLAVVLLLRVGWNEANNELPLLVELLDEDDQPMDARLEGSLEVGRPAGMKRGQSINVPIAQSFFMVRLPRVCGYRFRISSKGKELASIPFNVAIQK